MASSSTNRKRPFLENEEKDDPHVNKPPAPKRVRFPKGKKVKPGDEAGSKSFVPEDEGPVDLQDPKLAAKERAKRRNKITAELFSEDSRAFNDISAAEVTYQDDENFVEDGIQIEPFNLDKERQEGYFDRDGNFVEYVNENEIKDAWLDSVQVDTKLASKSKSKVPAIDEDENHELSADDIGKIKRRIADSLEPGETVLRALRRLKGTSNNRKERMTAEAKHLFDQLTEDAAVLMENGEYDVYHEQQEVFEREAEGYERLARVRGGGTVPNENLGTSILSEGTDGGLATSVLNGIGAGPSNPGDDQEEFDMFADDDDNTTSAVSQPISNATHTDPQSTDSQSDYVFDDASGYYYSSSLGYYYDPSTGLYCSAASGQWYSYNEATGAYEEIPADQSTANL